ncbi:ATP-binding protein [Flavobacterium sp.]|uniref:sensor histidine kinase n=1 Tax=Flavobacterium sp. TaxID=239 RepID=UPI0026184845|nr:ATP-binding protein [Flavobacterium sp.]MDG2433062.1 histidine kinase [Flavobacterium sp.]
MLSTQIEIQNQTMQHIGREIHDNIGQKLTLASLYAQQLAFENKAPHINGKIENISSIINDSLTELRQLSKSLTDDTINSLNIHDLIYKECFKVNTLKKCAVHFKTNSREIDLSYEIKVVLYRIIQEFIQNSIKYAKCKDVFVELNKIEGFVFLVLSDDGIGFDATCSSKNGIGLKNMEKRSEIINADFKLTSSNNGTIVTLKIPFNDEK